MLPGGPWSALSRSVGRRDQQHRNSVIGDNLLATSVPLTGVDSRQTHPLFSLDTLTTCSSRDMENAHD